MTVHGTYWHHLVSAEVRRRRLALLAWLPWVALFAASAWAIVTPGGGW